MWEISRPCQNIILELGGQLSTYWQELGIEICLCIELCEAVTKCCLAADSQSLHSPVNIFNEVSC